MTRVGCDLHTRKQQVAVLDTETGERYERHLSHAGDAVEQFYRALPGPVTVGIESTGYALWFHELMQRLGPELRRGVRRHGGPYDRAAEDGAGRRSLNRAVVVRPQVPARRLMAPSCRGSTYP